MQLHNVTPTHPGRDKRTRVGRGGKRGTSSGKGTKGQKSRSGRRIRPAIRELIQRLPKLRGYSNKPQTDAAQVISLTDLEKLAGSNFTRESFLKAGLIKTMQSPVKILSNGTISKAITLTGISVSKEAQKKIEAAGGKVQ